MQGYGPTQFHESAALAWQARWTPAACALLGATGLMLRAPWFMATLAALTSVGAFTRRSGYDLLFNATLAPLLRTGSMPLHGSPRRLGCGIGAAMYALSATGFFLNKPALACGPAWLMVVLAGLAALTNVCFASLVYRFLFGAPAGCAACGAPAKRRRCL